MPPTASTVRHDQAGPSAFEETQRCGRAAFAARFLTESRVLVAITGEVDATNRHELGRFVEHHTRVSKQLVLDLRGVDFFGSQGFTALHYISVQCSRRDVDWMVVGNRTVLRILGICDAHGELPSVDDIAAGLARLDHVAKCRQAVPWS